MMTRDAAQAHISNLLARSPATSAPRATPQGQHQARMHLSAVQQAARAQQESAWQQAQQAQAQPSQDAQAAQDAQDAQHAAHIANIRAQLQQAQAAQAQTQAQRLSPGFAQPQTSGAGISIGGNVPPLTVAAGPSGPNAPPMQTMLPSGFRVSPTNAGMYEQFDPASGTWVPFNGSLQDIINSSGVATAPGLGGMNLGGTGGATGLGGTSSFGQAPITVAPTAVTSQSVNPSVIGGNVPAPTVAAGPSSPNAPPMVNATPLPYQVNPLTRGPSTFAPPSVIPTPTPTTNPLQRPPSVFDAPSQQPMGTTKPLVQIMNNGTNANGFSTPSSFSGAVTPTELNPGGFSWANDNKFLQGYASTATPGAAAIMQQRQNDYVSQFGQAGWTPNDPNFINPGGTINPGRIMQ